MWAYDPTPANEMRGEGLLGVHGHVRELPRRESIRVGAGVGGGGREAVSLAIAGEEGGRRARQVRPDPESSLDRGGCSVTGEERQLRDAGGRRDGAGVAGEWQSLWR